MKERESKQRYPRYTYAKRVVFGKERVTSLFHSPKRSVLSREHVATTLMTLPEYAALPFSWDVSKDVVKNVMV